MSIPHMHIDIMFIVFLTETFIYCALTFHHFLCSYYITAGLVCQDFF